MLLPAVVVAGVARSLFFSFSFRLAEPAELALSVSVDWDAEEAEAEVEVEVEVEVWGTAELGLSRERRSDAVAFRD